jgi:GMP synthase-like glutamine amidotransferase
VLQPDSRLAVAVRGRGSVDRPYLDAVLSMHHQAVQELAACLEVVATSSDEVIEAIEETSSIRWWVGVQFHPEWMTHLSWSLGLFTAFVDASRGYSAVPRDEIETLMDEIQAWLREHDRAWHTAEEPLALSGETQSEKAHAALPLRKHAV